MQDKLLINIEKEIEQTRQALSHLGLIRPGTLTRQYRKPEAKEGGYWQLSYTHQQRSYSEHVREEELEQVRGEVDEYAKYKELNARWVELSIQRARRYRELARGKK